MLKGVAFNRCHAVKFFSKFNIYLVSGYFDPINIFFDNKNKQFSGRPISAKTATLVPWVCRMDALKELCSRMVKTSEDFFKIKLFYFWIL